MTGVKENVLVIVHCLAQKYVSFPKQGLSSSSGKNKS
jgi:hypothetical protein